MNTPFIPIGTAKENKTPYGMLSSFLRSYAKDVHEKRRESKTHRELAEEFYGSSEKHFESRIRSTVYRLNRIAKRDKIVS